MNYAVLLVWGDPAPYPLCPFLGECLDFRNTTEDEVAAPGPAVAAIADAFANATQTEVCAACAANGC